MQTGTKISVAAHSVLVGWALFGAVFDSEPLPFSVQEVSVISAQEFAALSSQIAAPVVSPEPAALVQPDPSPDTPDVQSQPDPEPERVTPEAASQAEPESVPDTPEPELPDPETSATPEAPEPPEPTETALVTTPRPKPRQTDRVAPIPVAQPSPESAPDEVAQPEVAPEEGAEAERETQEATAPEAANDRTVTEADQEDSEEVIASAAPPKSLRPPSKRPSRPTPTAQPADPEPAAEARDPVADAIAEAMAGQSSGAETEAPVPTGPPMTDGEKDALRVAVSSCWNVGSLSTEALKTTVVVAVSLSQDGKPDNASVRMLSSSGGSATAADQAFQAARRAIIRCGSKGFDLPAEKYGHWRDIEMTFNPERMRIR